VASQLLRCAGTPLGLAFAAVCTLASLFVVTPAIVSGVLIREERPATNGLVAERRPFSPIGALPDLDARKVALGRRLFHDPRLSGSGRVSCASCHDLGSNGALAGPRATPFDTPTVFNAGLNYRFGWEGKFRTLEELTVATMETTMAQPGVPHDRIYKRLRTDVALTRSFDTIYGEAPGRATVTNALAEFQRTLVTPSRFDRWLRGSRGALSTRERKGYDLFVKLGCVACHQGRNVGGNLNQRHGIFRPLASANPAIVRVPSLRNVAVTPPYFHDGSASTLDEAIRKMASAQLNRDLSDEEIALLAAFLRSLTGTYDGNPVRR
jgi:cytochrome c peroxidase